MVTHLRPPHYRGVSWVHVAAGDAHRHAYLLLSRATGVAGDRDAGSLLCI